MFRTSWDIRHNCVTLAAIAFAALTLLPLRQGLASDIKIDSREYKLMLKPGEFAGTDPRANIDRFVREELTLLVRAHWSAAAAERLQDRGLKLEKSRIVQFKDTEKCLLSHNGFAWRERFKLNNSGERSGEATGTFKFRSPDIFLAAASRKSGGSDCKFEEDLTPVAVRTEAGSGVIANPRSVRSQFSQSCSHETSATSFPADLAAVAKLNPMFEPGLNAAFSTADMLLKLVPGEKFLERVYESKKLMVHGDTEAEFALTVWYPDAGDHSQPYIAEISYKYETKGHSVSHEVAKRALTLLVNLQDSQWADPSAPTKTTYAKCD